MLVHNNSAMSLPLRPLRTQQKRKTQRSTRFLRSDEPKLTRSFLEGFAYWQPGRIIEKLNRKPHLPAVKRVARFIELFRRARELSESFSLLFDSRDAMYRFLSSPPKGARLYMPTPAALAEIPNRRQWGARIRFSFEPSIFPELHAHNEGVNRVLTELDKAASRYKWHPRVWTAGYENSPFLIGTGWKARNADEHWENYSIWFLWSQRNGELLDYFRRCRECKKWFFAVTAHQVYCHDKCRKRFASHSEEFKDARREYMRNYRKQEGSRDRAAKERLKLEERSR